MIQSVLKEYSSHISENAEATLFKLKHCFDSSNEFPVMGNSISQIMGISNDNGGSGKIANIILKDQSLTSKILSIVNSSSYNQFGGEINTISRAVVILGIDQIQSLSLGLMVFEKFNKGPMADILKSYACQSFLSAYFAKKLVEDINSINNEEAFLASMFHNLGIQALLYFMPDKYSDILNYISENNTDENHACEEVLGLSYADIGQFMAIELKLPKNIIHGIQEKPKIIKERPSTSADMLGQLSSLTNEIIETAACGDHFIAEQKLHLIIQRYKISFTLDYEKILKMLNVLLQVLISYCNVLNINPNENMFCNNLATFVNSNQEIEQQAQA